MTSFGFRLNGERCLFQVQLWKTFYLNALISSSCCRVASWPVYQRFSWKVAYRQHHHCYVIVGLFPCFWRGFSGCCFHRSGVQQSDGFHSTPTEITQLPVWKMLYSFSLTYDACQTRVLFTYHELRSTFYRTFKTHFTLCFERSRGWKGQGMYFFGNIWTS